MSEVTVGRRYAHALFLVAQKRGDLPGTLEDLDALLAVFRQQPRIGDFVRSPLVNADEKRLVVQRSFAGRVRPWVLEFLYLLLRKKRGAVFDEAVAEYRTLLEEWQGLQRVEVVSAVPLTDHEVRRVHAELERLTKRTVKLETRVDPALVGGLYARIGDRVIDRSVRGLLATLRERLFEVNV